MQAVAYALGQVHAGLVFERRGASLRLEVASGPPPAGVGRFEVAQLGAVWQSGALVHAAWDLGDLAQASREGTALFTEWAGSAAMAAAVSSDDDFGLDDVRRQFLQLAGCATRGSARIDVADGVSLLGE